MIVSSSLIVIPQKVSALPLCLCLFGFRVDPEWKNGSQRLMTKLRSETPFLHRSFKKSSPRHTFFKYTCLLITVCESTQWADVAANRTGWCNAPVSTVEADKTLKQTERSSLLQPFSVWKGEGWVQGLMFVFSWRKQNQKCALSLQGFTSVTSAQQCSCPQSVS